MIEQRAPDPGERERPLCMTLRLAMAELESTRAAEAPSDPAPAAPTTDAS